MKPLAFQTPKPPSNRSRSKETPQSKRSEIGSSDPKILSKSFSFTLSESSDKDASNSSSTKEKQQKQIVPKSLDLEFAAVSEDLLASESDETLLSTDLESLVVDRVLSSSIAPQSGISSEIIQGGGGSGKIFASVESKEALMVTDLLKESIIEFRSSIKLLDTLREGFGDEKAKTGRWSDKILLTKLQAGFSSLLILTAAASCFVLSLRTLGGDEEWSFTGLHPT
ncbi:uncharacterized protein LOC109819827 isoform X1 [Asparagus officinalis]|uniref:uncharacterized protein LOC109819827 isoform X1 n=1 Tax=Asparagus officinalis TaxID=4686 RepID=UPI00098DEEE5|nr:uncharacterized protein LOC109819827 isoform X1 [Asparagus officinalis]